MGEEVNYANLQGALGYFHPKPDMSLFISHYALLRDLRLRCCIELRNRDDMYKGVCPNVCK